MQSPQDQCKKAKQNKKFEDLAQDKEEQNKIVHDEVRLMLTLQELFGEHSVIHTYVAAFFWE